MVSQEELVPAKQIAGVDLVAHVQQIVIPTVGYDGRRAGLEISEIMGNLTAMEIRFAQCGS